jgi:hypothetical protein
MFMAQVVATTFSCFIQIFVLNLALKHIPNVCEDHQEDKFTCPGGHVFFSGKRRTLLHYIDGLDISEADLIAL